MGTRVTGSWTPEEDAKLHSAFTNTGTCKKKYGKEYKTDWGAIIALLPGRTKYQCYDRWHNAFDSSIDWAKGRTVRRRRQQAEKFSRNARWQELGRDCRAGSALDEKSVPKQMDLCLGSQHRPS
jgi:hypothetical protein